MCFSESVISSFTKKDRKTHSQRGYLLPLSRNFKLTPYFKWSSLLVLRFTLVLLITCPQTLTQVQGQRDGLLNIGTRSVKYTIYDTIRWVYEGSPNFLSKVVDNPFFRVVYGSRQLIKSLTEHWPCTSSDRQNGIKPFRGCTIKWSSPGIPS